jgi:hypothetical protein
MPTFEQKAYYVGIRPPPLLDGTILRLTSISLQLSSRSIFSMEESSQACSLPGLKVTIVLMIDEGALFSDEGLCIVDVCLNALVLAV